MGTEFEIIAGCLQGVQMLMKLLCLIIKDANLRERQRDIVGNPSTFQKPASWSDNPLLSNFILPLPSLLLIALYLLSLPP